MDGEQDLELVDIESRLKKLELLLSELVSAVQSNLAEAEDKIKVDRFYPMYKREDAKKKVSELLKRSPLLYEHCSATITAFKDLHQNLKDGSKFIIFNKYCVVLRNFIKREQDTINTLENIVSDAVLPLHCARENMHRVEHTLTTLLQFHLASVYDTLILPHSQSLLCCAFDALACQ